MLKRIAVSNGHCYDLLILAGFAAATHTKSILTPCSISPSTVDHSSSLISRCSESLCSDFINHTRYFYIHLHTRLPYLPLRCRKHRVYLLNASPIVIPSKVTIINRLRVLITLVATEPAQPPEERINELI
jgi:hypothetical protein